jgi:hypothetical protein
VKVYGRERFVTYTVGAVPTVTTTLLQTGGNFVSLSGNITNNNGSGITQRGFYYSTSPNVTTSSTKVIVTGFTGDTGVFQGDITNLTPGTTYYFRAYAINTTGTGLASTDTQVTNLTSGVTATEGMVNASGTAYKTATAYDTGGKITLTITTPTLVTSDLFKFLIQSS